MSSQLTAYITLICTSGVFNLYLCLNVFAKRHHYTNIANFFIIYTAVIAAYCFTSAFGLMATTLEQIKVWTIIQYLSLPISPALGLLFIMKYLGFQITKRTSGILLLIPIISFFMVATNDFHQLHYRVFEIDPLLGVPYIYQEIGTWYIIHGIYTFACMFVAFLLLLSRWKETAKAYRRHLIALMFSQFVPMTTAFLYLLGLTPPGIDPVPMVLWLTSLLYLWAINSSRMFAIMPIAKDAIFNSINDGVLVLDGEGRLIEFNQASKRMFPKLAKSMFGMELSNVWTNLSEEAFPAKLDAVGYTQELPLTINNSKRTYQVCTSSLQHPNNSKGLLIIFTDITELKRLQTILEQQAYYDELTQIFNRRAFFQRCEQAFLKAKDASLPFTIILIDIDHFKNINDTYGHDVGDQYLKHVATVCRRQLDEDILFARYGGEEFVLALLGRTALEGEALANQLGQHIAQAQLITKGIIISVTLSSGVAELTKGGEETLYQLLNKADKALYTAKRKGRNQVHVYTGA